MDRIRCPASRFPTIRLAVYPAVFAVCHMALPRLLHLLYSQAALAAVAALLPLPVFYLLYFLARGDEEAYAVDVLAMSCLLANAVFWHARNELYRFFIEVGQWTPLFDFVHMIPVLEGIAAIAWFACRRGHRGRNRQWMSRAAPLAVLLPWYLSLAWLDVYPTVYLPGSVWPYPVAYILYWSNAAVLGALLLLVRGGAGRRLRRLR